MEQACPHCGELARAGDRFCGRCGQPLPAAAVPAVRPRRWAWIWVWVPLVAVLAALALTNPSRQAYADWLAGQLIARRPQVAGVSTAAAVAGEINRATFAQNDLVFTVFDTSMRGLRIDVLGIFGHFVSLGAGPAN